jgi:hypothetical protein
VPLGECTGGLGCPAHTVIETVIKQETYQLDHFNKYPLFRAVSRYSIRGLAERAVGESTHVLAECNEFAGFVGKESELIRSIGALSIYDCRLEVEMCRIPYQEILSP